MLRGTVAFTRSDDAMDPEGPSLSTSPVFIAAFRHARNSSCLQANMPKRFLSCGFTGSAAPLAPVYRVHRIVVPSQQDWLHPGGVMPERCVLTLIPTPVLCWGNKQLCFLPHRDISLFAAFFEMFWTFVHFPCSRFSPTSRISSKKERWLFFFFLYFIWAGSFQYDLLT